MNRIKSLESELEKQITFSEEHNQTPLAGKDRDSYLMLIVYDIFAPFLSNHNVQINFLRSEVPLVKKFKEWPRRQVATRIVPYPPDPNIKFSDLPEFIKIKSTPSIKAYWFPISSISHPDDCHYIMNSVLVPDVNNRESILYVGINLKSKMTDIKEELYAAIQNLRKNLPYAQTIDIKIVPEWKEYFKVYDLREKGFHNNSIASYLFRNISTREKKASYHFRHANELINKNGYKAYF